MVANDVLRTDRRYGFNFLKGMVCIIICLTENGALYGATDTIGTVRVQTLLPTLVRLEVKGAKGFEDRPTFHIVERNWPGIATNRTTASNLVSLATANYTVKVPAAATTLVGTTVTLPNNTIAWTGTAGTAVNRVALPNPVSAPSVFSITDVPRVVPPTWGYNVAPSGSVYPDANGWDFSNNANDVYVFLPGNNGRTLRNDYIRLTGRSELIPLYALGSWDSRYYAYTQSEALTKIDTYRSKMIPLDVLVIDTDWRVGASAGYGVNTTLFPDMAGFISEAHRKKARIMFNDHPEPQSGDALSPAEVLFRNNGLRGKFDNGLDIWWFDRNWGTCIIPPPGINKEVFGMYLYNWITKDYYPDRRPMIMANVDGIDNGSFALNPDIASHRYTFQWTGDELPDLGSLAQEIRNMLNNGIIGPFAYTSCDLGGHFGQPTAREYCRWIEYGAFSPIYRPHCTKGSNRNPWDFEAPVEEVARTFIQLRMRLLPVFYAAARENYDTGEPILRRCDLDYPGVSDAQANDQYFLGKQILVAPLTTVDSTRTVWVPPGTWTNLWTGDTAIGSVKKSVKASIKQIPLFVKQGSIIPLAPDMQYTGGKPWNPITLDVYPAVDRNAAASLYEDDGSSNGYKNDEYRTTQFTIEPDTGKKTITVVILPAQRTFPGALSNRSWTVRIRKPVQWRDTLQAVTVDGQITTWSTFARNSLAMPLQAAGAAPDAAVSQVIVPSGAVVSTRTVVCYFSKSTPVQIRSAMSPANVMNTVVCKRKNLFISCSGRPAGTRSISLSIHLLNGQLVSSIVRTTDRNEIILPIAGNRGEAPGRGMYIYTVKIEQQGVIPFVKFTRFSL